VIRIDSNAGQTETKIKHMMVDVHRGLDAGLADLAEFGHYEVLKNLSGKAGAAPGSDPIPVRTGHLRRSEDYILPGRAKSGITTKAGQAMLVNTASYAHAIHEGNGPHAVFGPRPFMEDAVPAIRARMPKTMIVAMQRSLSR